MTKAEMSLYAPDGARLYLTSEEREQFLRAADENLDRLSRSFCMVLCLSGCRISEALALTYDRVDLKAGNLVFESLKKRTRGVYRAVPVPPDLLSTLDLVHGIKEVQKSRSAGRGRFLWPSTHLGGKGQAGGKTQPMSRNTAWRMVHKAMTAAGISGSHASPKGLRHGFGVHAIASNVPLNMLQKWLGHAQLSTTAIYADAQGAEAQAIAARMWS